MTWSLVKTIYRRGTLTYKAVTNYKKILARVAMAPDLGLIPANEYKTWKKSDLVERILELEGRLNNGETTDGSPVMKKKKQMNFSKFTTRKVAIRFAYLGWDYAGLAFQADAQIPTVEYEILKAMHKTKMIPSIDPTECEFSRCGRTDKGVSALRQVISLRVRSLLSLDDQMKPECDDKEIDYIKILNSQLPPAIVAYDISLRPPEGFNARFSCISRHYRYYFTNDHGLDIELMQKAAKSFLGSHDFRNFCKVDASKQITNFTREILVADIVPMEQESFKGLYYFDLKGSAFLWHQVRSMIAILFLIGQRYESLEIIDELLNVENMPRRPVYEMAADFPLVLHDCEFPEMEWISRKQGYMYFQKQYSVWNQLHELRVKSAVLSSMHDMIKPVDVDGDTVPEYFKNRLFINVGSGYNRPLARYQPLKTRMTIEPPVVANQKWLAKKVEKEKAQDINDQQHQQDQMP